VSQYYWFIIFVSLNSFILLGLAGYVSTLRLRYKISFGDGGNKHLLKAIRTHANGAEQVPIFSLLILGLSLVSYSQKAIAIFVVSFTAARVAHAVGMLFRKHIFRQVGAGLTYLLQLLVAVALLVHAIT
jgi:uncharacterized protein